MIIDATIRVRFLVPLPTPVQHPTDPRFDPFYAEQIRVSWVSGGTSFDETFHVTLLGAHRGSNGERYNEIQEVRVQGDEAAHYLSLAGVDGSTIGEFLRAELPGLEGPPA